MLSERNDVRLPPVVRRDYEISEMIWVALPKMVSRFL